jgi:hypothetical protein
MPTVEQDRRQPPLQKEKPGEQTQRFSEGEKSWLGRRQRSCSNEEKSRGCRTRNGVSNEDGVECLEHGKKEAKEEGR